MNDLAEQALHALDTARKEIARHPLVTLGVLGFALSATVVVAGGRIGASPSTTPLKHWFGLLPDEPEVRHSVAGPVMLAAILALLGLWAVAVALLRPGACSEAKVWLVAALWGAPFALGPPVLSTDIYSYVARGLLTRAGLDPYTHGPAALGDARIVAAIEPGGRGTRSTAGPLTTFLQHLAEGITGGHAFATVIVLRVFAVACTVGIGLLARELAGPRSVPALALTVLNPAVLLYVVSSAHFEGALAVLLLGALAASAQRRWLLAVVLAAAAAALKPVAIVGVPAVITAHVVGHRARAGWRIAAREVLVAAAVLAACTFAVSDGLGWRRNLSTITREHTPFAPSAIISDVIRPIVPSASFDDLAVGGRITAGLAAALIVAYLLVTMRQRALDRTIGYALLAAGLLSPVLYPWYLLWGLLCLAPLAVGLRRDWVIALSCAACVLTPAGFESRTAQAITTAALVGFGLVLLPILFSHARARRRVTVG